MNLEAYEASEPLLVHTSSAHHDRGGIQDQVHVLERNKISHDFP